MYFCGFIFIFQPFRFFLKCFQAIPTPRLGQICSFAKQTIVHFLLKITAMQIKPVFICKVKKTQTSKQSVACPSRWMGDCGRQVQVCVAHLYVQLMSQKSSGPLALCPPGRRNRGPHPGVGGSPAGVSQIPLQTHEHTGPGTDTVAGHIETALGFETSRCNTVSISSLLCSSTFRLWRSTASRLSVSLSLAAKRKTDMRQFAESIGASMKKRRGTWRL